MNHRWPTIRAQILQGTCVIPRGLQSVLWRIFFGLLPAATTGTASEWTLSEPIKLSVDDERAWRDALRAYRRQFAEWMDACRVDPRNYQHEQDLTLLNPLSLDSKSPWHQHFHNDELKKLIMQDVERTFPDSPYFRTPSVHQQMCDLLFLYSRRNPDLSYRQGMHELLATILLVVHQDAQLGNDSKVLKMSEELARELWDGDAVMADTFLLFERVMRCVKPWYEYGEVGGFLVTSSTTEKQRSKKEKQLAPAPFAQVGARDSSPAAHTVTPIVRKLERIQHGLLRKVDPDLWVALKQHDIEPQLYGIRWLRLLFGREFELEGVLLLWDAIFADDPQSMNLVDWICIVLLTRKRDLLMGDDYAMCLQQLMKPSPLPASSVPEIVQTAVRLRERFDSSLESPIEDHSGGVEFPISNNATKESTPSQSSGSAATATTTTTAAKPSFLEDLRKTIQPVLSPMFHAGSTTSVAATTPRIRQLKSITPTAREPKASSSLKTDRRAPTVAVDGESAVSYATELGEALEAIRVAVQSIHASRDVLATLQREKASPVLSPASPLSPSATTREWKPMAELNPRATSPTSDVLTPTPPTTVPSTTLRRSEDLPSPTGDAQPLPRSASQQSQGEELSPTSDLRLVETRTNLMDVEQSLMDVQERLFRMRDSLLRQQKSKSENSLGSRVALAPSMDGTSSAATSLSSSSRPLSMTVKDLMASVEDFQLSSNSAATSSPLQPVSAAPTATVLRPTLTTVSALLENEDAEGASMGVGGIGGGSMRTSLGKTLFTPRAVSKPKSKGLDALLQ